MNSQPLVSITILAYQHAEFLAECFDSILNQTYKNIEVIICDDGSTDTSQDIIRSYASKYINIKPILSPYNRGVAHTQLAVLSQVKGDYICLYDGDDIMYPEKIEKQVAFLETNRDYDMCFHNTIVYDNDTNIYQHKWLDKYLPTRNAEDALFIADWSLKGKKRRTPSGSKFGRASYILNGFTDKRTAGWIEFNFVMGMHAVKPHAKWHTIPEVLGVYRLHGHNISRGAKDWTNEAQEAVACYSLACTRFPQFASKIINEEAYWWFMQLIYNSHAIPDGYLKHYMRLFRRKYGIVKYTYLLALRLLITRKLASNRK